MARQEAKQQRGGWRGCLVWTFCRFLLTSREEKLSCNKKPENVSSPFAFLWQVCYVPVELLLGKKPKVEESEEEEEEEEVKPEKV